MDLSYHLVSTPRHAGALAERAAILRSIHPECDLTSDAEVWKAVQDTQRIWRRRLIQLQEAGWRPAQGLRGQYLRNCPPAIVNARPETGLARFCRCGTICPWCWARSVVKRTWEVVTSTLLRMDSMYQLGRMKYPYRLVFSKRRHVIKDSKTQPVSLLDDGFLSLTRTKVATKRKNRPATAFLMVPQPARDGKWSVAYRRLAVVGSDELTADKDVTVVKPTRRNIARLVSMFARYPRGNLFGDVSMLARLLAVRSQYRLLRFWGEFSVMKGER